MHLQSIGPQKAPHPHPRVSSPAGWYPLPMGLISTRGFSNGSMEQRRFIRKVDPLPQWVRPGTCPMARPVACVAKVGLIQPKWSNRQPFWPPSASIGSQSPGWGGGSGDPPVATLSGTRQLGFNTLEGGPASGDKKRTVCLVFFFWVTGSSSPSLPAGRGRIWFQPTGATDPPRLQAQTLDRLLHSAGRRVTARALLEARDAPPQCSG